ncbi:MAG: hypothetical protein Q4B68_06465 [Bacteroidales bacterium]|nr:hypothetical protein [Bacteroidales bacterium]
MTKINKQYDMKRQLILLVSLIAVAISSITSTAAPVVKSKEFYAGMTYTWTNANGGTVTSSVLEAATDPRQIMALLKYVYTNKNIPGILQCGYTATGTREGDINYNVAAGSDINKAYGIEGDFTPLEDGYTTLMVKVKDTWVAAHEKDLNEQQTLNYISEAIESVQIMTNGIYVPAVEEDGTQNANPGAVYRLSGRANRFFFISKGRGREWGGEVITNYAPFSGMYEEYSPVAIKNGNSIENFYQDLVNGAIFKVEHDCSSVAGKEHYFCMMGTQGTKHFDVTDLIVTIPDYRFLSWSNRDIDNGYSSAYTNYHKDHAPSLGLYGIQLAATATDAGNRQYKVELTWTSSLNQVTGNETKQRFLVWYRDIDGSVKPLMDAEGRQVTIAPGETYSHVYNEPQEFEGREITYVVSGQPVDAMFIDYAEVYSNNAKVFIPGYDVNEGLRLQIGTASTSDYDLATETNNYRNFITIAHNVVNTHVKYSNLKTGSKLTFFRYDVDRTSEATKIAELVITSKNNRSEKKGNGKNSKYNCYVDYNYTVNFYAQDVEKESTTGTYTIKTATNAMAPDFTSGTDVEVDFANFAIESFYDEFSVSTAYNEHPGSYEYKASFSGLDNGDQPELHSSYSLIKVYKTEAAITDGGVTLMDVENDNICSERINMGTLEAAPSLQFSLEQDRMIAEYDVEKVMNKDYGTSEEIGVAQRLPSWNYAVYENGAFKRNVAYTETPQIRDASAKIGKNEYVPVIKTYRDAIDGTYNTYGAPVAASYRVGADAMVVDKLMSQYTFYGQGGKKGRYYQVALNIAANGTDNYEIVKYRVWRIVNGGRAMEVAPEYMARLDQDGHPIVIDSSEEGIPAIDENCNDLQEFSINGQVDFSLLPEYVDSRTIRVVDTFGATDVTEDGELSVQYIVRLYTKPADIEQMSNERAKAPVLAKEYYIGESTTYVSFEEDTPTAVLDIDTQNKEVARIEYVNMLGQKATAPFSGLNVVITTFTDGTSSTVKRNY